MTAGASAAAKAAAIRAEARRGLWRRLLAAVGVRAHTRRADALAACWDAGAEGERRTAALLEPLAAEGWHGLYDRALPNGGRANADIVLIPPCGAFAVNVDAKLWTARHPVHVGPGGRLMHGLVVRDQALESVDYESREISKALGVPVRSVVAMHNAPVIPATGLEVRGVQVMPADLLVGCLWAMAGPPDQERAATLARKAGTKLPRYVERSGR